MGYKGRIIAVLFVLITRALVIIIEILQHDSISPIDFYYTIFLLIPIYFFGFQYDKAIYLSKEIQDIFEDGHIMLWKWERKTNLAKVSSGCEQIYGYRSKEFHSDSNLWSKVVYKKDKKIAEEFEKETLKGKSVSVQYRIIHKNGTVKWVQNMANPVFDNTGKFIKLNGVTIDITKQKEQDVNYKKLIDVSPVANIIIKDEKVLYCNDEGMKIIGANSLNEVIGINFLSTVNDEQKNVVRSRLNLLSKGELDKLPYIEYKVQKINGSIIDVESTAIRTVFNDEDAILIVARDISDDKKIKLKLKEAEEKYRIISEESLVGVYMFENGRVNYINKEVERILGYTREEVENMNLLDLFTKENQAVVSHNIQQMLYSNVTTLTEDLFIVTKNGDIRDVEIRSVVTTINNKKVIIGTIIDITNEKRAQNDLKKALKELQEIKVALDVSAIVSITDSYGQILYVNDNFCKISQYDRDELIGKRHDLFVPDFTTDQTVKDLRDTVISGNVWKGETKRISKDGKIYWFDTTVVPVLDDYNEPNHYIGIQYDITEKIKSQREVKYLAFYDSLTRLPNRNSLNKYIEEQLNIIEPSKDNLSLLFIDFDRFKNINDTLGHKYGDLMLQKAADILTECVNNKENVFRYGGDEFVIVLNHTNVAETEFVSQNIIKQFSDSMLLHGVEVFTTPSIGISLYPNDGLNAEELLKKADMAMYFAKESGKNNYKFFHASIGERASKHVVIEGELRKAMKENQFILYFQPKVHLFTNEIIGYELLIRWNHPKMGMIPPSDFIPIAEETGMIVRLGEWILMQACQKVQEISKYSNKEIPIAINISVKQFADSNFIKNSKEIIRKSKCKPSLLEFEITETVMQDVFSSIKIVKELKDMGIKISMDDFGTGYSNLSILSEMDIDILKIDRSFVEKMSGNKKSLSLCKTIINMGHSLGLEIVAEGIETLEQLELLKQLNCDIGQGYYFSRPLPLEDLINGMKSN